MYQLYVKMKGTVVWDHIHHHYMLPGSGGRYPYLKNITSAMGHIRVNTETSLRRTRTPIDDILVTDKWLFIR